LTEAGLLSYNLLMVRAPVTCVLFAVMLAACSAANRAAVHEDDMKKVFPWPRGETGVTIRVKPLTTMAKTCFLFGSFSEVQVTPDTTFYVEDEADKKFAYTPSRSPIRRLAKIVSMEILWPQKQPKVTPEEQTTEEKTEKKEPGKKAEKEAPQPEK
jgi:hypothetical protein